MTTTRRATPPPSTNQTTKWLMLGVVAVVILAAIVAVVASRGGNDQATQDTTGLSQSQPVTVSGTPLPVMGDTTPDPAVGTTPPTLAGKSFDGTPVTFTPGTDGKTMLVFLAHWCPHCRREVPLLVDWMASGAAPEDLHIIGVATATSEDRPNFPPSSWLSGEKWTPETMADSAAGDAATAYGLPGFPYFVLVNSDGTVATRTSGEIAITDLEALIATMK